MADNDPFPDALVAFARAEQVAELAAGLAHRQKNDLFVAGTMLDLIAKSPADREALEKRLAQAQAALADCARAARDILQLARPLQQELEPAELALDSFVPEIVRLYREASLNKLVSLRAASPASGAVVRARPHDLRFCLLALLGGAAGALRPQGGEIAVGWRRQGEEALIEVVARSVDLEEPEDDPFAGEGEGDERPPALAVSAARSLGESYGGVLRLERLRAGGARGELRLPLAV